MRQGLAGCLLALSCLMLPACQPSQADEMQRFRAWRTGDNATGSTRYQQLLDTHGVAGVMPLHVLLRSSRRWRSCSASEFSLPPPHRQAAIVPTLRVVDRLQQLGIVRADHARSGYRDDALNTCSGGSPRSRHVLNNALDFDLPADGDRVAQLCRFWRRQGPSLDMGLGFYTPTRIHIDTSGFRTWGRDHHRGTSLCVTGAQSDRRSSFTHTP
jgi:hypothetical protein